MTFRACTIALICLFCLSLAACGGHNTSTAPNQTGQPGPTRTIPVLSPTVAEPGVNSQLPAVPAPVYLTMPRMTASINAGALGSEFTSHGGSVTLNGTQALFDSTPQHVSWAIYSFGGDPGEVITALNYVVTGLNPGEKLYCAISDYVANRWMFIPLQTGAVVNFTLPSSAPGAYQSALGNTSVLFAVFGGDNYELSNLSLTYANRHSITGKVIDKTGAPVAGVTIKTPVGSLSTVSDATGNYTLAGLPDGNWPVLATFNGWTFYPQPQFVNVAGADEVAGDLVGDPHGARFTARDLLPGNDSLQSAPLWDFAANGPLNESISADDDFLDAYKFTVATPGHYVLKFSNPDRNIFAPELAMFTQQIDGVYYSEDIYCGEVAVDFTAITAGESFRFIAAAQGGGGNYTVSLSQQPVGRLGCEMKNGAAKRFNGLFQVVRTDDGLETDYFTRSSITGQDQLSLYDRSYPIGAVKITPVLPNHTFTPSSFNTTVTDDSTVSGTVFAFTPPAIADSYEPNDTKATAHALGALPFNSAVPLQVTSDPAGDNLDVYVCTPPAGQGLRVNILYSTVPGETADSGHIFGQIFNNAGAEVAGRSTGSLFATPTGMMLESTALTDGNPYYIYVEASQNYPVADLEVINYALQVTAYPAHRFQIGARVGGATQVDGMKFSVYDNTFTSRYVTTNNNLDYLTVPRYVPNGSQFRVDCYRTGTPFDGLTQLVTVTADTTLNFDAADLGQDSHEPNGTQATASQLAFLPATISATYSQYDDSSDFYSFGPGDGRPFKIELVSTPPSVGLSFTAYDSAHSNLGTFILKAPGDAVYMANDGNPGQQISIGVLNDYTFPYTIKISNADAYKLSGVIKSVGLTGLGGVVVNTTTGDRAQSNAAAGGAYQFPQLVGPGTYQLEAYVMGYGPGSVAQSAIVTTMDTTSDFLTFTPTIDDNYEPNNTAATATAITLNTDYLASIDGIGGDIDYYKIPLTRGDQVSITFTPEHEWELAGFYLLDQYSSGNQEDYVTRALPLGVKQIDYTAAADFNYIIEVFSDSDGARYKLRVQKLN